MRVVCRCNVYLWCHHRAVLVLGILRVVHRSIRHLFCFLFLFVVCA